MGGNIGPPTWLLHTRVYFMFPHLCLNCAFRLESLFLHCPFGKRSSFKPAQGVPPWRSSPGTTLMPIILSPDLLSPPSSHHLNHVSGSPVASPYNLVESLRGGRGPESPQCLPSLLPTLSLGFASRPPAQVRNRLRAALTWGKILFMSLAPSSSLQPWQCRKLGRFLACHQGQPGGGRTGGLSRPHPPCGQAPPRLPPKKRKGQEGPAPAWPLPPLQADSHAPTPEFSM